MTGAIVETIKQKLGNPNIADEDLSKILSLVEQYASEGKPVQEIITLVTKKMGCKDDNSSMAVLKLNKDVLVREAGILKAQISNLEKTSGSKQEIAKLRKERNVVLRKLKALQ